MQDSGSFDPRSLANPDWFSSGRYDSLFIEAYEMALAPSAVSRKVFRFDDIVVLIKTARLTYLEAAGVKIRFGEERQLEMSADTRLSVSDLTPKLVTIQPYASQQASTQPEIADRSSEYVSLIISTNYRNIAFRRLFSHVVNHRGDSMAMAGNSFRLPFDLPPPDLSPAALDRFQKCRDRIQQLPSDQKQKIILSLHWHLKGVQSDGLDSFISLWIALETLAMKSSNITALNEALAAAYGTTSSRAAAEFGIGRIFGLRSRIVHSGVRKSVSTDVIDYLECLYADLLVYELLNERLGRARSLLSSKNIDIKHLTAA